MHNVTTSRSIVSGLYIHNVTTSLSIVSRLYIHNVTISRSIVSRLYIHNVTTRRTLNILFNMTKNYSMDRRGGGMQLALKL
jgi:hypothetical protein